MTRNKAMSYVAVILGWMPCVCAAQVLDPPPAPSFSISASNITMPSNGIGNIPFTLTSVNKFAGGVVVSCAAPPPAAGVREPACGVGGPVVAYTLTEDGTVTGGVTVLAEEPLPAPGISSLRFPRHGEGASWTLAGVLLLGFGLRRRGLRRSGQVLLGVGLLLGLAGLSACGGPATLTPGAYIYTLTASGTSGQINNEVSASTTVTVTVPPGIVVQPAGPVTY